MQKGQKKKLPKKIPLLEGKGWILFRLIYKPQLYSRIPFSFSHLFSPPCVVTSDFILQSTPHVLAQGHLRTSVVDPKLFFLNPELYPDPTSALISDPDCL
jgi:hypothetical protein